MPKTGIAIKCKLGVWFAIDRKENKVLATAATLNKLLSKL